MYMYTGDKPEMQGVRTPSPITMEVPSMVTIKRMNLAQGLFSKKDLIPEALFVLPSALSR